MHAVGGTYRLVLGRDELKRRIDAARTLHGMKQTDLAELLHEDGFGKHDIGRIERGEIPLMRNMIDALCRHLQVPAAWFEEPDPGSLFEPSGEGGEGIVALIMDRIDRLEDNDRHARSETLGRVIDRLDQGTQALGRLGERLDRIEQTLGSVYGIADALNEELALRDASRAVTGDVADRLDSDAQADQAESRTPGTADATPESAPARRAGNP